MLLIGSIRLGLLSMVINFSSILITMGLIMGFAGIRLDVFTLLIGSIALGLAVDDTIHFFHNFRRYYGETRDVREAVRRTMLTAGRAMLFTTLVLVTGFLLFMLATLNNVFNFGLLTGITLILALLADFLLAPERLNPDWVFDWIMDPQALQPGTKMPGFYPDVAESLPNILGGDADRHVAALRDYLMNIRKFANRL